MHPKIIKTDDEYRRALEEVGGLIALDPKPSTDEAERLALISLLIETYESAKFKIERPSPLEAIKFRMDEQSLKQRDLIPFIGSKGKVSEILAGKRSLTVNMIRALYEGLGIPAEVLLQDSKQGDMCDEPIDWRKFPLKEMIRRGWLNVDETTVTYHKSDEESLLDRFFEPLGGKRYLPVLCRRTLIERAGKTMDKFALWAWTARVLIKAKSMDLPQYKKETVNEEFTKSIAHFSFSDKGPLYAKEYLAQHGIPLIIESHLSKTHLDGGAMLTDEGRPVIGLTLRHDRIDNFWFNLVHELVHIWKHLKSHDEAFVDNLDSEPGNDPREKEADRITGEIFISRTIWKRSDAYRQRTPDAINELASQLKIHPAIIAGRIRHDTKNYYIFSQMLGKGKVRKLFSEANGN